MVVPWHDVLVFCASLAGLFVAGDLLSVPKGTPHWFDGGETADFTCIRVFTDPAGWEAHYTGDEIWRAFPLYDKAA